MFRHGHIQKLEIARDDEVNFRCDCLPEMKKNLKYNVKLSLCNNGEHEGEIIFASCAYPAGKGPRGSGKVQNMDPLRGPGPWTSYHGPPIFTTPKIAEVNNNKIKYKIK